MENCTEDLPRLSRSGFRVKVELRMTPDKGIGVFAAEFIPANTRVYDYETTYYNKEEAIAYLASLSSDEERKWWLEHAYGDKGKIAIEYDDCDMINHSNNPALARNSNDGHNYTTRDVYEGEELTVDYRTHDYVSFFEELRDKYGLTFWFIKDD